MKAARAALLALAGLLVACDTATELVGVYEEPTPIAADRVAAIRLTLFEYTGEAGGHLRRFALDDLSRDQPYLGASDCAWFGPNDVRSLQFRIEVPVHDGSGEAAGEGSGRIEGLVVGSSDGTSLELTVTAGAEYLFAGEPGPNARIRLVRNDTALTESSCGEPGGLP